jgi:hypothetical protein
MSTRHIAAAAAVLIGGAAWQLPVPPVSGDEYVSLDGHVQAEAARLGGHFAAVDVELRTRDVANLTQEQRSRRAQLMEWLRDYRDRGEFPLNDGFADMAVPIFRDDGGTLCAMAYLIDRSGRSDIVERVAASRNTAYIRELVDDPELVSWLDEWGLSAQEAGRIQPWYEPLPEGEDPDMVGTGYALVSMALAGTSLMTSWANVTNATRLSSALGFLAGSTTAAVGLARLDEGGGTRTIALANTAVGVLAVGAALHGLNSLRRDTGGAAVSEMRLGGAGLTFAPDVITVADRSRPGIVFQARF